MAATAFYGKLGRPELGGNVLVQVTGKVTFSSAKMTSSKLTLTLKKVVGCQLTRVSSTVTKASAAPYLKTADVATGSVFTVAKAATAAAAVYWYHIVGY